MVKKKQNASEKTHTDQSAVSPCVLSSIDAEIAVSVALTPLAYLMSLIADQSVDPRLRIAAAKAAAPYLHAFHSVWKSTSELGDNIASKTVASGI